MNKDRFDSSNHQAALDSFVDQLKKDSTIIAAFVYGSLVRGDVWSESDIDMLVITKDDTLPYQQHWLKDGEILIQVDVHSRKNFRNWMDVPLQGSVLHHIVNTGNLLFSTDETISEYLSDARRTGSRDKTLGMMIFANNAIGFLSKVRKSIIHKKDPLHAFRWIHGLMIQLANLVIISEGGVPSREVILQAREFNSKLFKVGYTDMLENGVSLEKCQEAYDLSYEYLTTRAEEFLSPIMSYILEEGGHCGISHIDKHFRRKLNQNAFFTLITACDFLVDLGILSRMVYPLKLTSKSRYEVHEAGYLHMEGELL
ncbi:MAG: nucleotidyltransferase domain-containing protein [Candidatus Thorarchaeota archaeon]